MLQTKIIRLIWQTVRRITNAILGVKGLNSFSHCLFALYSTKAH